MKRSLMVATLVALGGCANAETDGGNGGSGGAGTTTVASSVSTTGSVSSTSSGSACAQDCSTVEVPACYTATCNADTGACDIHAATDGTACEDGAFCTVDDKCQDGLCKAGDPRVCDAEDECAGQKCDEASDSCIPDPKPDQTPCTPTGLCAQTALCIGGQCLDAGTKDCSALTDACNFGSCEPATGDCVAVAATDGIACVNGDPCESNKTCTAGVCSGTPISGCNVCVESEPNDSVAAADTDATCSAWGGAISVVGDKDYFAVHVAVAGSRIDAEVNDIAGAGTCPTGFDSVLRLFNAAGTQIATDDESGVDSCSYLGPTSTGATNLAVGDYYVEVEEYQNDDTSPNYVLRVDVLPPGCGNGIIEGTEQCDGTAIGAATCASQGFASGTLGCDASCAFDTTNCNAPGCGDGILSAGEECDDGNANNTDGCSDTCLLLPACDPGQTRVFLSSSVAVPIPDVTTITSPLSVSQTGTVQKLWVALDITHGYDADLDISLIPPSVPEIILSDDNGSFDDNYTGTIFSTAGTTAIASGTAPFAGIFAPQGSFTPVIGTSVTGTWTLKVTDDDAGVSGTLNSWRLVACVQ